MPETLPPDLVALREGCDAFLRDEIYPMEHTLHLGADDVVPPEVADWVRTASRQAGLFGLSQPRDLGGLEAGALALTVVREALSASGLRLAAFVLGAGPGALRHASAALRESHLAPVMRGDKRSAFAFTEPQGAHHPTAARRDGDDFVVHGSKAYVTGGGEADFYVVVVRVEEAEAEPGGTALLVVDRERTGVHIEESFRSLDGSEHVSLHFHDVRVPQSCLIGAVGEGMPRALRDIGDVRLALAAQASGYCLWTHEHLEHHLKQPHRSGSPLADKESIRLRLADLRIEAYVARSALYRTARLVDSGENAVNEVMATKVFCTETVGRTVDAAIQLVGGRALVHGHPLERLYRRVRAMRLAEGASDLLRLHLARGRIELGKGRL